MTDAELKNQIESNFSRFIGKEDKSSRAVSLYMMALSRYEEDTFNSGLLQDAFTYHWLYRQHENEEYANKCKDLAFLIKKDCENSTDKARYHLGGAACGILWFHYKDYHNDGELEIIKESMDSSIRVLASYDLDCYKVKQRRVNQKVC